MKSNGTLNNDDKILYDRGFKRATSALGKTETVILKGESHKIITTAILLSSASREHDPSVGSIAVYSNDKMTIRGHGHTDCDNEYTKADEVSSTTALTDREYILLLTSLAQNEKYPLIARNMFIEKMILTQNQCALIPYAPIQLSHIAGGAKKTALFRTLT